MSTERYAHRETSQRSDEGMCTCPVRVPMTMKGLRNIETEETARTSKDAIVCRAREGMGYKEHRTSGS